MGRGVTINFENGVKVSRAIPLLVMQSLLKAACLSKVAPGKKVMEEVAILPGPEVDDCMFKPSLHQN